MGLCPASNHIFSSKITFLTNFKTCSLNFWVQNTRIKPFIQLTTYQWKKKTWDKLHVFKHDTQKSNSQSKHWQQNEFHFCESISIKVHMNL